MLIGLKGYKGVGKDTVADYLVSKHGYTKMAFADKLKDAVAGLFGISRQQVDHYKDNQGNSIDLVEVHLDISVPSRKHASEYVFTWREFLQRFGTEMGRNVFGQDFWVEQLVQRLPRIEGNIVITDARFENEARKVKELGGCMVEISRPGCEPDGHASEEPLPEEMIDYKISNDGTMEQLYDDVDWIIDELR